MKQQVLHQLQECFARLGNPLKMEIFLKIAQEGCECDLESKSGYEGNCVTAIVKELGIPQSTASTYVKDLRDCGLIECKKKGKYLYCKPSKEALINIKSLVDGILIQTGGK